MSYKTFAPLALLWTAAGVLLALWTTSNPTPPSDDAPPSDRILFDYLPIPALLESLPDERGHITILDCNQAACRQLGYTRAELIGQPLSVLNTEVIDQATAAATLIRLRKGEFITLETTQRRKDGAVMPVYVWLRLVPFARGEVVLSQQVDITVPKRVEEQLRFQASLLDAVNESIITTDLNTDRVQLEEALRQLNRDLEQRVAERTAELQQTITELEKTHQALRASEERYRRIVETAVEGVWVIDAHTRTTFVNRQMAEMLGTTVEWMQGRSLMEFVPPAHRLHVERRMEERKQGRTERLESIVLRPDGRLLPVFVSINPLFDDQGTYQGALALMTDISQHKRAEEEVRQAYVQLAAMSESLLQSRTLLRTVVDSLSEGVALLDEDGRVLMANRALASLLRLEVDAVIGLDWKALSGQFAQVIPAAWMVQQKAAPSGGEGLFRVEGADGQMQMVAVHVQQLHGAPEQRVVVINDVTERMQIEAQAIEQERFAANGKLAAVVAHEVNTPLQAIENCLFLAEHAEGQRRDMYIEIAQQEIHRIGELMHQLLNLYRPTSFDVQQVDLNELVKRLLILVQYQIQQQHVVLSTEFAPTLPSVWGRADELSQVVLNIMMNALQAMPNGGVLAISTMGVAEPMPLAESTPAGSRHVVLRVADSGTGISPELHARIFEPFFTTRANGSGLGLAVSQKIVAGLGGEICLTSAPGQGSSFEVWLPAAMEQ